MPVRVKAYACDDQNSKFESQRENFIPYQKIIDPGLKLILSQNFIGLNRPQLLGLTRNSSKTIA